MNLVEFLQDISIQGWKLWSNNGGLSYDAPGDASIDSVLEKLKQHKAEILELLNENPGLLEVYPLSYSQQAMWFLWRLAPESHAFNSSLALRIYSPVDVTALHQTFQTLLERYPIWRTIFPQRGKQPIQQVLQNREIDFKEIDCSTLSEEQLKTRVIQAHQEAFDLERGPTVRVRLFTHSQEDYVLLVTTHHIAHDIWSIDILLQEVPEVYQATRMKLESPLPALNQSYIDYVRWQHQLLASERGEKLWEYWQQKMAGAGYVLQLPCDSPRPVQQTYNGTYHLFHLSPSLTEKLQALAQQEGATLYMLLLAAYQILLYRYTQQEDILVGSLTSGRSQPEFAPIYGYFTNPVVMRANCLGDLSFREFLAQVKQTVLEALAHQDFPFSLLVERLQYQRDPSRSPVFQTMFALHKFQQSQAFQNLILGENKTLNNWGGLEIKPFDIPMAEGQFDLTLEITKTESSLIGVQKYNTDLFERETIVRMVGHFQTLLEAIVTAPNLKLSEFSLITATEEQEIIKINNDPAKNQGLDYAPIHILDSSGQLLPLGIEGEIYTSASVLSSDSPEIIEHPELGRLYKTGQWGKRRSNGDLELLGLVKRLSWLKGQRINLYAVEVALRSIPEIQDCYGCIRQNQLVAYIVPSNPLSIQSIEFQIKSKLPVEVQPSILIPVVALPYTETGKVDENSLAKLEAIDSELVARWQQKLEEISTIEQVAVVVEQKKFAPPFALHLWDILPQESVLSQLRAEKTVETSSQLESQDLSVAIPAISYGGELILPENSPQTLSEVLTRAAESNLETGLIYINANGKEIRQSYSELLQDAEKVLGGLRKLGLKPEDKVILQLEKPQDFIVAFWGCVLGGFIPAPLSVSPNYDPLKSSSSKLLNTWNLLEKPLILTSLDRVSPIQKFAEELNLNEFRIAVLDNLKNSPPETEYYQAKSNDLALLMLTSGSTGKPKGVMLSHQNIISRSKAVKNRHNYSERDISLNWFPLDHVVGLVMFHIRDVYLSCQQIQAAINLVIENPINWINWLEKYAVTVTWAPNFAYGLVNAQAEAINQGSWDLSSVRLIINGGEAIVDKTARQFMELLTPHQLPKNAMKPAWGMSETTSGVVFSDSYTWEEKREDTAFVDLGNPISGVSLRIVNEENQVIAAGKIGQIQITGLTVTSGYYNDPEKQQEAFTADGWFKTGDLGFLKEGRLTITGRQKDVIIINGINYYSHEIEAVVEELEEIEVSYTAACAVRQSEENTDKLAIFFSAKKMTELEKINLLKEIRSQVIKSIGINPDRLIPVQPEIIPKTAIGKIQRSQLKQQFEAGEFNSILKEVDLLLENHNTIPNWFYQQVWHEKEVEFVKFQPQIGISLIFFDSLGLGSFLSEKLAKYHQSCIKVFAASEFTQISEDTYTIALDNPEHYQQLLESLSVREKPITQIVHLVQYQEYTGEISELELLEEAQLPGLYSLLYLIQALDKIQGIEHPVQLLSVANNSQVVQPKDKIAYEKTTVLGLLKTIVQEIPGFSCRHIDLPMNEADENKMYLWQELCTTCPDLEIAYRNGKRFNSGLEVANLASETKQELPLQTGGVYLLSGGLGGIGIQLAEYLLQQYQARLILIGRTPLSLLNPEKIEAYEQLQKLPGELVYQDVDISNLPELQNLVSQTVSKWGGQLNGIIHLAGMLQEKSLLSETKSSISEVLLPKVSGTWALHQLLKDNSESLFIHFASVNGFLGGATVGAYSAANSFQTAFCHYQNTYTNVKSYCLSWSMWDETGMSKGYQMKDLSQAKGYFAIAPSQGLSSLLATLCQKPGDRLIGLDRTKPYIQYLLSNCQNLQQLTAYFTSPTQNWQVNPWEDIEVRDRLNTLTRCEGVQLEEMPLTENGKINLSLLLGGNSSFGNTARQKQQPRTQTEHQLVEIFEEVLKVSPVGIEDNFFELGGHSLLATQLVSRIRQTFEIDVPLTMVFQSSTIIELAERVDGIRSLLVDIQTAPSEDLKPGEEEIEL